LCGGGGGGGWSLRGAMLVSSCSLLFLSFLGGRGGKGSGRADGGDRLVSRAAGVL